MSLIKNWFMVIISNTFERKFEFVFFTGKSKMFATRRKIDQSRRWKDSTKKKKGNMKRRNYRTILRAKMERMKRRKRRQNYVGSEEGKVKRRKNIEQCKKKGRKDGKREPMMEQRKGEGERVEKGKGEKIEWCKESKEGREKKENLSQNCPRSEKVHAESCLRHSLMEFQLESRAPPTI